MERQRETIGKYYGKRKVYKGPYHEYERCIVENLNRDMRLLDVGCGQTFPMAKKWVLSGAEIHGVDPVADITINIPGVHLHNDAAEKLSFKDKHFDFIVSCAVFEHIQNPLTVLDEFNRVLKPEGKVVILTPSKFDYVSIFARIIPNYFHKKIVRLTEGRDETDTFPTFYQANSMKDLKKLAWKTGFKIQRLSYLDQSPYAFRFSTFLYKTALIYHRLINSIHICQCLKGWILCVMEKNTGISEI